MLDFYKLKALVGGYRSAFEGLICQLGRRHPPEASAEFRVIDGAGGDGGIECYWTTRSGAEYGYQAKFHLRSGDIDWRKIDASVEAAMGSHPKLIHMVIAIACDLRDTVPKRRGKSGRDYWNKYRKIWEAAAAKSGRPVVFELWDASKIEDLLVEPRSAGLRAYWFGEIELTKEWFRGAFKRAEIALEERYNPEDHVEVSVETLFGGLLRDSRFRSELNAHVAVIAKELPKERPGLHQDVRVELSTLREVSHALASMREVALEDPTIAFSATAYLDQVVAGRSACSNALVALDARRPKVGSDDSRKRNGENDYFYRAAESAVWQVHSAFDDLEQFLNGRAIAADTLRFALVTGRAGTGKSHLLAVEVDRLTASGLPAVIMLGSQFSDVRPLAEQISAVLGLDCNFHAFLNTMNAAAEASCVRGLVAIDAINEGGAKRWRNELGALAYEVTRRPWLAFVVACRSEYVPYLVTDGVTQQAARVNVQGFTTEEEQERAAQVYLDNRGILRPATPWLSPEFSNPLFLRTTATSLEAEGRREYPTGLHGTKEVFRFYLQTAGRHLTTDYDGSNDLFAPLARAVKGLAACMAHERRDHVLLDEAQSIVGGAFSGFAPQQRTWLELLRLRGILRFDPDFSEEPEDPLDPPNHLVRFAFQRFQDHLVAEALLDEVTPTRSAFVNSGPLVFLLERFGYSEIASISYEWHGVFQALWLGHAERNARELFDDLPQGPDAVELRSDDFVETLYWRSPDAFTDRTLQLFNEWIVDDREYSNHTHIRVLLRLCARDHPWNAELLHRNLVRRKLPERDAFWTVPVNALGKYGDSHSEAFRLARWCQGLAISRAEDAVLKRALLTLGWLFSTTNISLRDHATKAAISILLIRPRLLPDFVKRFADVDDPYVVERVAAACAGACLRDPNELRLHDAADAIYKTFFAPGSPPRHLLTRDYGRLIVELANDKNILPEGVLVERCQPPYNSPVPRLPKNTKKIEVRAEKVGAGRILDSCTGWVGDFGHYVMESGLNDFSRVRLSVTAPMVPETKRWEFKRTFRYDIERAKYWVVNRAISLGWTDTFFPKDSTVDDDRYYGGRIERIGKKYQWIAYFELLARIADNYWMMDDSHEPMLYRYDTAVDTCFVRNVEITLPALDATVTELNNETGVSPLPITEVSAQRQAAWVFEASVPESRIRLSLAKDVRAPGEWYSLYRYTSSSLKWPADERKTDVRLGHPFRQEEFHFQIMIALPRREAVSFVERSEDAKLDFYDWLPGNQTDAGFLYELGLRSTWNDGLEEPERTINGKSFSFRQLTMGYHWEGHLDKTVPSGLSLQVPSPWLLRELRLHAEPHQLAQFTGPDDATIALGGIGTGIKWCIARRSEVDVLFDTKELSPVMLAFGERNAWPKKGYKEIFRRRWNGTLHFVRGVPKRTIWFEDSVDDLPT